MVNIFESHCEFGVAGGQSIGWVDKGYNKGDPVWSDLEFILCVPVNNEVFQAYLNTTRLFYVRQIFGRCICKIINASLKKSGEVVFFF